MSYVDQHRTTNRKSALIAVAALHGVAIYAIVSGLAVKFIKHPEEIIDSFNVPRPKPLPEVEPKPEPQTDSRSTVFAPRPPIPLPAPRDPGTSTSPLPVPVPIPQPVPTASADPLPLPDPTPSFAVRNARPRGKPGEWVTTNHYPARDLRERNQGTSRYSLLVSAAGGVDSCVVVASSGHPGLDEATCRVVSRNARFNPATDETGASVQGSYSGSVTWVIPQE